MENPEEQVPDPTESLIQETPRPAARRFRMWDAIQMVISVAILSATLFTLWSPENIFSGQLLDKMIQVLQTTPQPEEAWVIPTMSSKPRIGIVAGHKGNDSGAVCQDDGLTEVEVNEKIATLVRQKLLKEGFEVDLLEEFDKRLQGYEAIALVSIHNDSCEYINDEATGFKVVAALGTAFPEKAGRLTACLVNRYGAITGLKNDVNKITKDMSQYHAFDEISRNTTAVIIETGYLNLDRTFLTQNTTSVADGVVAGILCFVRNEPLPTTSTQESP